MSFAKHTFECYRTDNYTGLLDAEIHSQINPRFLGLVHNHNLGEDILDNQELRTRDVTLVNDTADFVGFRLRK